MRVVCSLKRNQEGLARYALSSASHPGSHRNVPSTQRAAKTKSRLFATQEGSHGTGETSEDEQVERILEAGSKQLFGSEEGKERLRENSYSNDETAKTVLNAAHEALDQSEDNAGDGERGSRDQVRAKVSSASSSSNHYTFTHTLDRVELSKSNRMTL